MTNPRMVYLLEEETQLNMIQLRDHVKLLSTLPSPRFCKNELHRLPISQQALSDCFAYIAQDINEMLEALRYHYGEPEADESASNAQQKSGLLAPAFYVHVQQTRNRHRPVDTRTMPIVHGRSKTE